MPTAASVAARIGGVKMQSSGGDGYLHEGWEDVNACATPGSAKELLQRKEKRKTESLAGTLRSWIEQHQIGISVNLLLLLALVHTCLPRARRRTRKFFELSYHEPATGVYNQGPDDLLFVTYWIVVFTGLRDAVITYALLPSARFMGITKTKAKVRFAEQAWLFLYYAVFWPLGLYIMYKSNYWLNLSEMWTNFPTRSMGRVQKWYYLVQFAFWLQQIVVVHIEERRNDHWQMFTHHIVTCALLLSSYGYYQTKVGNAILVVMDVVDLLLPAAKMLKYSGFQTACDVAFGAFIVTWFSARHVIYLCIVWSVIADVPQTMPYGCYSSASGAFISPYPEMHSSSAAASPALGGTEIVPHILQPFFRPGGPVCFNKRIHYAFVGLLLFLQGITLMWFAMIVRVAWRVLKGNPADDSRSDDGDGEEESADEDVGLDGEDVSAAILDMKPVEEYVGVEGLSFQRRASPIKRYRKSGSHASGISIRGHSEPKELLGRIGCDKPT